MTNRQVLPSEQPLAVNRNYAPLAIVAGVIIAALLAALFAALYVSGVSLAIVAAVVIGVWFGICSIMAAALLALPRD